jgi:hypothetical protein
MLRYVMLALFFSAIILAVAIDRAADVGFTPAPPYQQSTHEADMGRHASHAAMADSTKPRSRPNSADTDRS